MQVNKLAILPVLILALIIVTFSSAFVVDEGRQAIITEFGKPIGAPITEAGLHFKLPFLQEARYVDKRILSWDGFPNQIPTKDKKYIKVDTTARFKIINALKFIQTVRNTSGAKARLDAILDSATRDVISNQNLVEAVRNSNAIIDKIAERERELKDRKAKGEPVLEEEVTGSIDEIQVGRENLSTMIAEVADKELRNLGIQLIDVQLRRISYEESVERKVYERMISERQRIAQKIRSIGQGEKAKIEGRLTRDLQKIDSEAYKDAEKIKGKGEAIAVGIYAKSFAKDPSFFEFLRTMDAYKNSMTAKTKMLFSTESEFLRYFKTVK